MSEILRITAAGDHFVLPGLIARAVAEKAARIAAEEVGRWLRGEPPAHCLT